MATPPRADLIGVLESYFIGRTDAYALQQSDGSYHVYREPLDRKLLELHCDGSRTVAAYPLTLEGKTPLGVLDVDSKNEEAKTLIKDVCAKSQEIGLPYFVEPSGRKGYHVWFLFKNLLDAGMVRHFLMRILETCHPSGRVPPGIDLFPAQVGNVDLGNAIKLPFGVHKRTNKRTLFIDISDFTPLENWGVPALNEGSPISEDQLSEAIQQIGQSRAQQEAPKQTRPRDRRKVALPCTPLMERGVPEGQRDTTMFYLVVRYRDRDEPPELAWEHIQVVNKHNKPPMGSKDLRTKVTQAYKDPNKRPGLGCMNPTITQFCDPNCPIYSLRDKPGYGQDLPEYMDKPPETDLTDAPHSIRIIMTEPRYYEVGFRTHKIVLNSETLFSMRSFQRAVWTEIDRIPELPWKQKGWEKHINQLMSEAERERAPHNTSERNELIEVLYQWLRSIPPADSYEEVAEGRPMRTKDQWLFVGRHASQQLKNRFNIIMPTHKLWAEIVRSIGGNSTQATLNNGERVDMWWIPGDLAPIGPPEDDDEFWDSKEKESGDDFWAA